MLKKYRHFAGISYYELVSVVVFVWSCAGAGCVGVGV
jgi:hypothetical protein